MPQKYKSSSAQIRCKIFKEALGVEADGKCNNFKDCVRVGEGGNFEPVIPPSCDGASRSLLRICRK